MWQCALTIKSNSGQHSQFLWCLVHDQNYLQFLICPIYSNLFHFGNSDQTLMRNSGKYELMVSRNDIWIHCLYGATTGKAGKELFKNCTNPLKKSSLCLWEETFATSSIYAYSLVSQSLKSDHQMSLDIYQMCPDIHQMFQTFVKSLHFLFILQFSHWLLSSLYLCCSQPYL